MNALLWIIIGAAAVYVLDVAIFPVRRHRICRGTGWLHSPITGGMRRCDGCDGGRRLRWAWLRGGGDD